MRTHCRNGHLYSETGCYYNSAGALICKECDREKARRALARKTGRVVRPNPPSEDGTVVYSVEFLRERCIETDAECWEWQGAASKGYGCVGSNQTGHFKVHAVMYVLFNGPLSEGTEINHLCRNKLCCNPEHLEMASHLRNMQYYEEAREVPTHCKYGHAYAEVGYYEVGDRGRVCKQCKKETSNRNYRQNRQSL